MPSDLFSPQSTAAMLVWRSVINQADKAHAYSEIRQMHNDVLSILFRLETLMNKKGDTE